MKKVIEFNLNFHPYGFGKTYLGNSLKKTALNIAKELKLKVIIKNVNETKQTYIPKLKWLFIEPVQSQKNNC